MTKSTPTTVSTVKGGKISRSAKTGRFMEVNASGKNSRSSATTVRTIKEASAKRSGALQRLADR